MSGGIRLGRILGVIRLLNYNDLAFEVAGVHFNGPMTVRCCGDDLPRHWYASRQIGLNNRVSRGQHIQE